MKWKRVSDREQYDTWLQDNMVCPYDWLVDIFGTPGEGDCYKVDAMWIIQFEDSTIATIYNWKNGRNYNGPEAKPVEKITDWNIGGSSEHAAKLIAAVINDNKDRYISS